MSILDERDFDPAFIEDLGRDFGLVIDTADRMLDKFERNYGDPFTLIIENPKLIRSFCDILTDKICEEIYDKNRYIEDIIGDAVSLCLWGVAHDIMNKDKTIGTDRTFDMAEREFEENPLMPNSRGSRRDSARNSRRDSGRRSSGGRRDSNRRDSGGRYGSRRRNQTRQRVSTGDESRHSVGGTLGGRRNRKDRNARDDRNYYEREEAHEEIRSRRDEPVVEVEKNPVEVTASEGDIITTENSPIENTALPTPMYILTSEKVLYSNGKLEVSTIRGGEKVDYEKHRVDKIFPQALLTDAGVQLEATLKAIREAETAIDNHISSFVNNPETKEPEIDSKLLKHARSFKLDVIMDQAGARFDPIDIRDQVLEQHGGDIHWLNKNAMIINVGHVMGLGKDKDIISRVDKLIQGGSYRDISISLVTLAGLVDPSRWIQLHDLFTTQLNYILVVELGLNIISESITGDLHDLNEIFKGLDTQQLLVVKAGFENFGKKFEKIVDVENDDMISIKHNRQCVYLPINSGELEIGMADNDLNIGRLNEGTKLFSMVAKFQQNPVDVVYTFITLDGKMLELCTPSVDTGMYYDIRILN